MDNTVGFYPTNMGSIPVGGTRQCPFTLIGSADSLKRNWMSVRIRQGVLNKYYMRTREQIDIIKSRISDPYAIIDFISNKDINYFIKLFNSHNIKSNKVYKNTGPITLDILKYLEDPIIVKILNKIKEQIGNYEITAGFFFWTNCPHIIHNDDTFELPDGVYKAITIPLQIEGTGIPKLCFFDQFYFHGPAKFFKGSKDIPTYYNKQVYDYSDVDGITDIEFEDNDQLFTHLKPQWLEGLSLHSSIQWNPTTAIVFDSVRLHCASDFRQLGIKSKLGISIFTKL